MKYSAVFFDWGDTLSVLNKEKVPVTNNWIKSMIHKLYGASYRLAIISNTHRYQDAHWIRKELAKHDSLSHFELVISSAIYGVHKPDLSIFQKALDFMELDPTKVVMVGDHPHCDGASRLLGLTYMHVQPGDHWEGKLYDLLDEKFPVSRKLSRISEYGLLDDRLIVKLVHLSEGIGVGDTILLDQTEYVVLDVEFEFTKDDVLKPKPRDKVVEFKVRPV